MLCKAHAGYVLLELEEFSFSEAKEGVGGQREVEIVSETQSTNGCGHSIDERM